ncbi:unnamed protein product, partial [Iphiclides podalirius]
MDVSCLTFAPERCPRRPPRPPPPSPFLSSGPRAPPPPSRRCRRPRPEGREGGGGGRRGAGSTAQAPALASPPQSRDSNRRARTSARLRPQNQLIGARPAAHMP